PAASDQTPPSLPRPQQSSASTGCSASPTRAALRDPPSRPCTQTESSAPPETAWPRRMEDTHAGCRESLASSFGPQLRRLRTLAGKFFSALAGNRRLHKIHPDG